MSRTAVSMSRVALNAPAVPLYTSKQSPVVAFVVLIGVAALAGAVAAASADPQLTPFMATFALMFVAAAIVVYRWSTVVQARVVRIDPVRSALRFAAPVTIQLGFAVLGLLALLPLVSVVLFGLPREAPLGLLLLLVVGGGAVVGLGQQLWALRAPAGLTLSDSGLRGVRGSIRVAISWSDLSHASVIPGKAAQLVLNLRTGAVLVVDPHRIGSDPNVVAPVVNFFLANPRHRATLATPMAALALVEEHAATTAG